MLSYLLKRFAIAPTATLLLTTLVASGCTYSSGHVFQSRTDYFAETVQREHRIKAAPLVRKELGLALAGGGTKAADFSLGVIKGLAEAGVMDQIDFLSSVSGGSYAALWYYARLLPSFTATEVSDAPRTRSQQLLSFFQDCLPKRYATLIRATACPPPLTQYDANTPQDPYRYQNYLRGYQDIFRGGTESHAFSFKRTREDYTQVTFDISLLAFRSIIAAGLNVLPNILFDIDRPLWDTMLAPSRTAYTDGIIRTFAAEPPSCALNQDACGPNRANLWRGYGDETHVRETLTFDALKHAYEHAQAPLWIINTTAGEDRIPFDFNGSKPFQQTSFELTPYGSGSGLFGYSAKRFPDISPIEAVMSSAAFLDAQVKSITPPLRNIATTLMKVSTLDWGRSYPNPATSPTHAFLHRLLPFPFYFFDGRSGVDQVQVHLSDGGQSENLGAYALINRRAKDIIISDHSFDRGGIMEDLCHLKAGLANDWNGNHLYVFIPGLAQLDAVCDTAREPRLGYDIFNWEHPVLLGCITSDKSDATCTNSTGKVVTYFSRLYLIKPAFPGKHSKHHLGMVIATAGTACRPTLNKIDADKNEAVCQEAVKKCKIIKVGEPYHDPTGYAGSGWPFEEQASCELVGFMMKNAFVDAATNDTDHCPHFPQISTVAMTTNSSPWIYGASRELARYYARQLGWFFAPQAATDERFQAAVTSQTAHPMTPASVDIGVLGPTVKAGEYRSCLNLQRS